MRRGSSRRRIGSGLAACFALAGCASAPHVTAIQQAPIAAPPRSIAFEQDALPFGITSAAVAGAAARAGFVLSDAGPQYRLALTAAAGSSRAGSYVPPASGDGRADWLQRPDRSLRARFAGGHVLRVTAVLVDTSSNREVWRGTGLQRTADPKAAAPELVDQVLAKLPHR
jgi:hypothetical protein